jgi:hypothetical protein
MVAVTLAVAGLACNLRGDQRDKVAPAAGASVAVTAEGHEGAGLYPLSAIKSIPDTCPSPRVVVAVAPSNDANHYAWTATRQAVLANPQFKVVSTPPEARGEVNFRQIETGQSGVDGNGAMRTLIAYCKDGDTCNRFAAMHRAVVRSSDPRPICGDLPGTSNEYQIVDIQWNGTRTDLPKARDTLGQCTRLGVCMITADPSTPGDPARECQASPASWKLLCALKPSCAEVLACMKA